MIVIGLTGGIASGKSTVSRIIKDRGIPVIDGDIVSREVTLPGSPVLSKIVSTFGGGVLNNDGTLNRKELSNIVFNDNGKLEKLNSIIHPEIKSSIKDKIENLGSKGERFCVIDAALLIECKYFDLVDFTILVYVDKDVQIKRLMQRDGVTYEKAIRIIDSQMSLDEKKKYADYLVDNNQDIEFTKLQIGKIIEKIEPEGNDV